MRPGSHDGPYIPISLKLDRAVARALSKVAQSKPDRLFALALSMVLYYMERSVFI